MNRFVLSCAGALAQQSVRVAGVVESFDDHVLAVKSEKLVRVKINLTDKAAVFGVTKATLSDAKPGAFIGVGAMPQPDGPSARSRSRCLPRASASWVRASGRGARGRTAP